MAEEVVREVAGGIRLTVFPLMLGGGAFTNVYDISWATVKNTAAVHVPSRPVPVLDFASTRRAAVAASGAFFFLADEASASPSPASLNFAVADGRLRSLPVTDREALICQNGQLTLTHIPAHGRLMLNGRELVWEGSRTGRVADCYAYGNGNAVINGLAHPVTGKARVLNEQSRTTPVLPPSAGWADVAFRTAADGTFVSTAVAPSGNLDIFSAHLVLRCPTSLIAGRGTNVLRIGSIGPLHEEQLPDAAVSVGPSLGLLGLEAHPINHDHSLGDNVAFASRRLTRLVLFQTTDGHTHLRLFDGRPGSRTFTGVTPDEASAAVSAEANVTWGCFLDGGQTAKICIRDTHGHHTTYGNRHYLRWPRNGEHGFRWTPDAGRPVGSLITLN
ncbi:hypothetical protein [Streptomyces sp. NPDC127084]|uniref:hypothetical protein n=1 Tax=Streptomyces sp. NPDC127084 TaxID=3347133 RepID=UPI0036586AB1